MATCFGVFTYAIISPVDVQVKKITLCQMGLHALFSLVPCGILDYQCLDKISCNLLK
jgi:hypothetical protein